jgi:ATP-dependent DNA helicase RecQ
LYDVLSKIPGSGVVYVRNRKRTKELAHFLQSHQISADFYHAGLAPEERNRKQDAWMTDKTRVMVATNAFGMGIDKPEVRAVVHMDLPDSLEAYFQEAGRGGRDGKKAFAVLLYHKNDAAQLQYNFETSFPDMKDIRRTYEALGSYLQLAIGSGEGQSFDFDIAEFCQRFNFEILKTYACFKVLEQDGWIALTEGVHIASTLKVIVDRETLYDYQLKNKPLEKVIKGLFRAVHGLMTDYVSINEFNIASFLQMSVSELERILNKMHNEKIVEYRPKKDKPQIVFLQERIDSQYLAIDYNLYMFRKKRAEFRLKKAIEYAELDVCRSQQLLHYFGQLDASACGICDVCIESKNRSLAGEEFEVLKDKIQRLLKRESLTLKDIVDSFAEKQRTKVIQTIGFLLDEGILKKEGELFSL